MGPDAIKPKWNADKQQFFLEWIRVVDWDLATLETQFKNLAASSNIKPGELMLPLRIMLVGGKYGPGVFDIAGVIGKDETVKRIQNVLEQLA